MKPLSLIFLMFVVVSAFAETPVIQQISGQQVKATWSNGNVAALNFIRSPPSQVVFTLRVIENLCAPSNGDMVKVTLAYRYDALTWVWEKNSDPSQIGNAVTQEGGDPIFFWQIVTNEIYNQRPDLVLNLPRDRLEFSNLNWLPGFENGRLKPFTLDGWMSENMVLNSQTGVFENRIVSGSHGVHFKATGDLTVEIEKLDSVFNISYGYFSLLGNTISWVWQNSHGPCQITFNPSMTTDESNIEVETYFATVQAPTRPYLADQDGLLKFAGPAFLKKLDYVQ